MNVLTITEEPGRSGGAPRSQLFRLQEMKRRGVEVSVIAVNCDQVDDPWTEAADHWVKVGQATLAHHPAPPRRLVAVASNAARVIWAVLRLLVMRRRRPDVVYAAGHDEIFVAGLVARTIRRPLVLYISSPASWRGDISSYSRWRRFGFESASRYLFVSHAQRSDWLDAGVDPARSAVVYNGIDVKRFQPRNLRRNAAREALGVSLDARLLLYAGSLDEHKGLPWVLDRIGQLPDEVQLAVLGVAHDDDTIAAGQLARLTHAAGADSRVLIHPPADNMVQWYLDADIVLVPSLVQESLSRVILEALACETPVVASDRGGNAEAIGADRSAWTYDPDDDAGFRRAIDAALAATTEERRSCRDHVVDNFELTDAVSRLLNEFAKVVA